MATDQHFTSTDLVRLTAALDTCVRPFDFPTVDAWRSSLLSRVMELLEAPIGHVDFRGAGLERETLSRGYNDGVFETYVRDWLDSDPAYAMLSRLDMTTYTRRQRYRAAGAHWTAKYQRSAVYNEFYLPNGLVDGAGILFTEGSLAVHIHAETRGPGGDLMDQRGRSLLLVLEPALRATSRALAVGLRSGWQAGTVLNATDQPVGMMGESGEWVHQTPALVALLNRQSPAVRAALLAEATGLARGLFHLPSATQPDETALQGANTILEKHGFRLSAVLLGADGPFARPYVLIRIEPAPGGAALDLEKARRAGLTPREVEVALLLARGLSDKAIADTLDFSWHAARRHTERILKKLRIGSRSGVAHALAQMRDGTD